jgi:hypothetical protein
MVVGIEGLARETYPQTGRCCNHEGCPPINFFSTVEGLPPAEVWPAIEYLSPM